MHQWSRRNRIATKILSKGAKNDFPGSDACSNGRGMKVGLENIRHLHRGCIVHAVDSIKTGGCVAAREESGERERRRCAREESGWEERGMRAGKENEGGERWRRARAESEGGERGRRSGVYL